MLLSVWVAADVDFVACFESNEAKLSHIKIIVLHGNITSKLHATTSATETRK